jgi:hypothetical protein
MMVAYGGGARRKHRQEYQFYNSSAAMTAILWVFCLCLCLWNPSQSSVQVDVCENSNRTDEAKIMFDDISSKLGRFHAKGISHEYINILVESVKTRGQGKVIYFQVYDGNLYLVRAATDHHHYESRAKATKLLLYEITKRFKLPNMDFLVFTDDEFVYPEHIPAAPIFTYCKNTQIFTHRNFIPIPDFTFWAWPEAHVGYWKDISHKLITYGESIPFAERKDDLFWRGALSAQKRHQYVKDAKEHNFTQVQVSVVTEKTNYVTLPDHCHYKYLLHLAGNSYSSRLKYLMACGSVVFFLSDPNVEFYYSSLEHMKHVIHVQSYQEIRAYMSYFERNVTAAEEIGQAARRYVQDVLSQSSIECYVVDLLTQYSKLLTYNVTLHQHAHRMDDLLMASQQLT